MRFRVVKQVARTAFVEFWRSPAAVFWTYGFPLMMALVTLVTLVQVASRKALDVHVPRFLN